MLTFPWLHTMKEWLFGRPKHAGLHAVQAGGQGGSGKASLQLSLDPRLAPNGVRVTIPETDSIKTGEVVWLQWATPDSAGQFRTKDQIVPPMVPNTRDFKVPPEHIRWHIGKSLSVHYEVIDKNSVTHPSPELPIVVARVTQGLPTIQSVKIIDDKIRLSAGEVPLTLEKWPLVAPDQFVTVKVVGAGPNGEVTVVVADKLPVPAFTDKMSVGVITVTDLRKFRLNVWLDIRVWVSFDQNASPPQVFPSAKPQLVS